MTNIIIKDDLTFTIAKSEGATDFPRKFYPVIVSGNQLKLRTLSNNDALNFDVWSLENFQIDGVTYTDVFEAQNALLPITWNEGTATPESSCHNATFTKDCDRIELIEKLDEILTELKNDDSYQLFEDTDGNVLLGKIDDAGLMKYYKPDGSVYTGDVKPYSRETKQTITDYCADSVPYSLIQLRDADTKEVVISIWRNDNDLSESTTAPANVVKGICVVEDLTGKACETPVHANLCNTSDITDVINAKLDEVITALNTNSQAEQALLTSIDTKLDELVLIKDELVLANSTLTGIKTDTAQINTNLETVIEKLDTQIEKLEDLKVLITDTNTKLDTANATLTTISTDIATIKTDIGLIKTDVSEIKTDVKTIITKLEEVITSLSAIETKLDTVVTELQTINTTLQTEFDQTQTKLDEIKGAIELKGSNCENRIFFSDCDKQEYLDALKAIENAVIAGSKDYTAILESIDNKASNLATIVTELQTANTTLTGIKADTTATNTKLDDLIFHTVDVRNQLIEVNAKLLAGNLKLDSLVTLTTNIDANIALIKADVATIKADISEIKGDVKLAVTALNNIETLIEESNTLLSDILAELNISIEIENYEKNNGTINYLQRDTILWNNETGVQVSKISEYSINGIDWTTTAPAGDVNLGYLQPPANTFAQDLFQLEDCDGVPVGTEQQVYKVVQLNKSIQKICNTADITTPIVEAINTSAIKAGKKLDFLQWRCVVGEVLVIQANKFTTISMHAGKGEFTIENTVNNFSSDIVSSGTAPFGYIEFSADGIGTDSGATDLPIGFDTRANAYDLSVIDNAFNITCIRDGVLNLELYK